jgi:hypothetical protein
MKPLKPIEQYTQITILKEVKERFGSINSFNKITGRQHWDLYYLKNYNFKKRSALNNVVKSIYKDINDHQPKSLYLSDYDRIIIRDLIKRKHDTFKSFSDDYPQFSPFWLSRITNGSIIKITAKVKKLLKTLDIEL